MNTLSSINRYEASRRLCNVSRFTFHASRFPSHVSRLCAFTLLEILVAVALLSFIVLGLFAMFNQTQRAFRASMTQSDILEAGRAVAEMIPHDLEQMAPSYGNVINFSAVAIRPGQLAPLTQFLPGAVPPNTLVRTNYLEDVFMLLRDNQNWVGIGYCVRTNDPNGGLWYPLADTGKLGAGTLYRFTATLPYLYPSTDTRHGLPQDPSQLYVAFKNASAQGSRTISNRICDGVLHFYLRPFATNGFPLFSDNSHTNACFRTTAFANNWTLVRQTMAVPNTAFPDNMSGIYFWSNAVPVAVDMELGLLEQYALDRYNSIGSAAARLAYLRREETSTRVHIFRQRIPIRNFDPSAYQ